MKMRKQKSERGTAKQLCVVGLLALAFTGCKTAGYDKSEAVAYSIQDASAEVQMESKTLDQTMGALKQLVNQPTPDLRLQYSHFSDCLNRLTATAQKTAATGRRMDQKTAVYLQTWDKDLAAMDYERVRDVSQARRNEVARSYDSVHKRYQETQEVVEPLIGYLQDIRRALDADLTPGGLESVRGLVSNAEQNAGKVQTALAALTAALNNSSTKLSPVIVQTEVKSS